MTACTICRADFAAANDAQVVCSIACAKRIPAFSRKQAKIERQATRAKLEALESRSKVLARAQAAFNAWVRARDAGQGCISCGTHNGKQNAGHYRSVGSCPELRFEPANCHLQCERCNTYLHGNLIDYRAQLLTRIGDDGVAWLEGPHEPAKHSTEVLRAMGAMYRAMARELEERE